MDTDVDDDDDDETLTHTLNGNTHKFTNTITNGAGGGNYVVAPNVYERAQKL